MKRTILFLLVFNLAILVGCNHKEIKTTEINIPNSAEKISFSVDGTNYFDNVISNYYPMDNLEEYSFYIIDGVLYADYHFNKDVLREEILNSRRMFMDVFLLNKPRPFGISPPRALIEMNLESNEVNFRVFIGNSKIIDHNMILSVGGIESIYFEDSSIVLPSRIILTEEMRNLKKSIERTYWWSIRKVTFQKSYSGDVLFIRFDSRKEMEDSAIDYIKEEIELKLANYTVVACPEINYIEQDYLGILIEFYIGENKYYEEAYCIGKNYWFNEYWGNHDFFLHSQ